MHRKILINLAVLTGILAFLLPNSYLLAGNMGWDNERQPGDPLDGYWYMSGNGAPGCFHELVVYKIENGDFAQILKGNILDVPIRSIKDDRLVIEFRTQPGLTSKYFIEDRGQVLWAYRYEEKGAGGTFSEVKALPLFTTCDDPTSMGVLSSLVSRVFDPARPTKKVLFTHSR